MEGPEAKLWEGEGTRGEFYHVSHSLTLLLRSCPSPQMGEGRCGRTPMQVWNFDEKEPSSKPSMNRAEKPLIPG